MRQYLNKEILYLDEEITLLTYRTDLFHDYRRSRDQ